MQLWQQPAALLVCSSGQLCKSLCWPRCCSWWLEESYKLQWVSIWWLYSLSFFYCVSMTWYSLYQLQFTSNQNQQYAPFLIAVALYKNRNLWSFLYLSQCFVTAIQCQKNQEFFYNMQACNHTCRSLSGPDPRCGLDDAPVEGCGCPEGTHLNQGYECTPKAECFCHYYGGTTPPGPLVIDGRQWWADYFSFYSHFKSWNLFSHLCVGVFCFPCNLLLLYVIQPILSLAASVRMESCTVLGIVVTLLYFCTNDFVSDCLPYD